MPLKFGSWWQTIQQHRVALGIIIGSLAILALIIVGYQLDVTGFNVYSIIWTVKTPSGTTLVKVDEQQPAKTIWDWLQLAGIVAIPVVVGIGASRFTAKQAQVNEEANRKQRETELQIAENQQREMLLQGYLDKMSELLLEKNLRKSERDAEVRNIARARTLTVLSRLDVDRKERVIRFLCDSALISTIDLSGADLRGIDLLSADLRNATLREANLREAYLGDADLTGADLALADLHDTNLEGATLRGADLSVAKLTRTHLSRADLSNACLAFANLSDAMLGEISSPIDLGSEGNGTLYISAATLTGADLCGANLTQANLHRVDLRHAKLSQAKLIQADLSKANLSHATLGAIVHSTGNENKASFRTPAATLTGTDLVGANLTQADLHGVNLTHARLNDAILSEADLNGATITTEQLATVKSLKGAIMPNGDVHP